jgi:hypothetical protein
MISPTTHKFPSRYRIFAIVSVAIFTFFALASTSSHVSAMGERIAVFGIAIDEVSDGELEVATREGVITLIITEDTKISDKRRHLELDEVGAGSTVTGYYTEEDDKLLARSLAFKKYNAKKRYEHVIGVVVEKNGKQLTVITTEGEEVTVDESDDPESDPTNPGSMIVTVVEENEDSGNLDSVGLRTAEQTIERLNEAIDHEISLAQEKLLKVRMSGAASVHLTRLYATLDEIEADSKAKIESAFNEFQASYTTTMDENLIAPPLLHITGRVLTQTLNQLVVAARGNGQRSYLTVPSDVEVVLIDGEPGTAGQVRPNLWVDIQATPQTKTASPIARIITIIPDPNSPGNGNGNGNGNANTINGTVVVVEAGNSGKQKIIVVTNPDGSDGAAAVTPDTVGGDDLEPGQEVTIVLGDDGFSADEIVVDGSSDPPPPPVEYLLTGKIREVVSGQGVILDDVFLVLDNTTPGAEPLTVGEQIQFKVIVDEAGRWVVVGIEP